MPARISASTVKSGGGPSRLRGLGASFWETINSGYTPGAFTKAMQGGMATPADYASSLRYGGYSMPSVEVTKLEFPDIKIPRIETGQDQSLSSITKSIADQDFGIDVPNLFGGGGGTVAGATSKLPIILLGIAAIAGAAMIWKKLKNRHVGSMLPGGAPSS